MTNTEFFIKSFLAFFVIIAPLNVMMIFAALTRPLKPAKQRSIAFKSNFTAFIILIFFTVLGSKILTVAGISLPALKISGGFLLLVVSHKMIFDSDHRGADYGNEEEVEAEMSDDISVFPLATPLLAGAGAISLAILFSAEAGDSVLSLLLVIVSFGLVFILSFVLFIMASRLQNLLGATFVNVITRVMGILLAALGIQFLLDGLQNSGLF